MCKKNIKKVLIFRYFLNLKTIYIRAVENHAFIDRQNKPLKKIKNDYINNYVVRYMYYRICDIPNT